MSLVGLFFIGTDNVGGDLTRNTFHTKKYKDLPHEGSIITRTVGRGRKQSKQKANLQIFPFFPLTATTTAPLPTSTTQKISSTTAQPTVTTTQEYIKNFTVTEVTTEFPTFSYTSVQKTTQPATTPPQGTNTITNSLFFFNNILNTIPMK